MNTKLLIIPLVLSIFSCAQKNIVITESDLDRFSKKFNIESTRLTGDNILKIGIINDKRANSAGTSVGKAHTGLMNSEADIYLYASPAQVFRNQFTKELSDRNIRVDNDASYTFNFDIKKLSITEEVNESEVSRCDIEISYQAFDSKSQNAVYKGSVSSNASGTENILDATSSHGPVLKSCFSYLAEKFATDEQIKKLLKN